MKKYIFFFASLVFAVGLYAQTTDTTRTSYRPVLVKDSATVYSTKFHADSLATAFIRDSSGVLVTVPAGTPIDSTLIHWRIDPDSGLVPVSKDKISPPFLNAGNRKAVRYGDNIQAVIDSARQRSVSVYVHDSLALTRPIYVGNSTAIFGEVSNLTDQSTIPFAPRGVLNFPDTTDGIFTDTASTVYRSQKVTLSQLTLNGSGYNNLKAGVNFKLNPLKGAPGLGDLDRVYIQNFGTGVRFHWTNGNPSTGASSDGFKINNSHFMRMNIGIDSTMRGIIDGCFFWNFLGSNSFGLRASAYGLRTAFNHFELGNGTYGVVDTENIAIKYDNTSTSNVDIGNVFTDYTNQFITDAGSGNIHIANIFNPTGHSFHIAGLTGVGSAFIGNAICGGYYTGDIIISGSSNQLIGFNTFNSLNKSSINLINISNSNVQIPFNSFYNTAGSTVSDIKFTSTSSDCMAAGIFPQWIVDQGTRNVINYRSKNVGDPRTTGNWYAQGTEAFQRGVIVYDSSKAGDFYLADQNGTFHKLLTDDLSGTATLGVGDSVQVTVTGITSSAIILATYIDDSSPLSLSIGALSIGSRQTNKFTIKGTGGNGLNVMYWIVKP